MRLWNLISRILKISTLLWKQYILNINENFHQSKNKNNYKFVIAKKHEVNKRCVIQLHM